MFIICNLKGVSKTVFKPRKKIIHILAPACPKSVRFPNFHLEVNAEIRTNMVGKFNLKKYF